jgi:protoporphyrinogen oxidase
MTLRGGLQELIEALVARLEGQLLRGTRVVGLERAADGRYRLRLEGGQALPADAVVLSTPSYVAADLVEPMHSALAAKLRAIRHVSTATVSLGFRRAEFEHPLDGFGFVVSAGEKSRLMACTWTSTKFDGRAPHDHLLLRGFVGGPRNESLAGLPDEALVRLLQDELRQVMGGARLSLAAGQSPVRRGAPGASARDRGADGCPAGALSHRQLLSRRRHPRLHQAGAGNGGGRRRRVVRRPVSSTQIR